MEEIEKMNVYQRVHGVMSELSYIQKGSKKVNGQYAYASHDQVTAALHPYLVKYRLLIVPTVKSCQQDGNRTVQEVLSVFINIDNPKDQFQIITYGHGVDAGDKGPGKALSYAFKTACLKGFGLETGEDADNDANARYEPEKCLEFNCALPQMLDKKELDKINRFLQERSTVLGKHVEDIKREAVKRMPEFLEAVKKWNPKKKDDQ